MPHSASDQEGPISEEVIGEVIVMICAKGPHMELAPGWRDSSSKPIHLSFNLFIIGSY